MVIMLIIWKKERKRKIFNNIENTFIESSDLNLKAYWQLLRQLLKPTKTQKLYPH